MSGRSTAISPNGASAKRKAGSGGNPLKLWPVPKGQKGLQSFIGGHGSASDDDSGPSSMEGTSTSEQLEEEELVGTSVEDGPSSSCEGSSSSCADKLPTNSVNLLEDITQLNSDDSDQD